MTGLGWYAPSAAWLFALLAPLVLFYFLKLRRPRALVPSLVLWRRVLADKRVNSPFQRFKRHMLLLLQILLLCLLVLAAMQPFVRHTDGGVERRPIVLDCSASMAALDRAGGRSRMDEAKERAERVIRALGPHQQACLVVFDTSARRLTGFTSNRRVLLDALESVGVQDTPAAFDDALRLVQSMARQEPFSTCLLFSDGNIDPHVREDLSCDIDYRLLPPAGPNLGIVGLSAQRQPGGFWEVFVSVSASSAVPQAARLTLHLGDDTVAEESLAVTSAAPERFVFQLQGREASSLVVRLEPGAFDSLASDNEAFLDLPPARDLVVAVVDTLGSMRHALQHVPGLVVKTPDHAPVRDLLVTDSDASETRTADVVLQVGVIPEPLRACLTVRDDPAGIMDWVRDSALLRHVELRGVDVIAQAAYAEGMSAADVEQLGYVVLAETQAGPFLVRRTDRRRTEFTILVHTDKTTLPYRVAFPVLMQNLAAIAFQQAGQGTFEARRTGVLKGLVTSASTACRVVGPQGGVTEVVSDEHGQVPQVPAPQVGWYELEAPGPSTRRLGVSLLDVQETSLRATEELSFREDLTVAAETRQVATEKPLRSSLLLLAWLALLGEWWWYQRRSG